MSENITELASGKSKFNILGTLGINGIAGMIDEAYAPELTWPGCVGLYNRIYRSNPEVQVARTVIDALSAQIKVGFVSPDTDKKPTGDDSRAIDFGNQVLDDMERQSSMWLAAGLAKALFYGWVWWEVPYGLRKDGWVPPAYKGHADPWRSSYDDGLVGFRRLSMRAYSSFEGWDMHEETGIVDGFIQNDYPNKQIVIPTDRSLHWRYGDMDNPEGLATLEPIWRLERIKSGFEIIQGIGMEHAAGYLDVTTDKSKLSSTDKTMVRNAARNILSGAEGNYALWPKGFKGEVRDTSFSAASPILDAIRYYGILILATINMQWVALGTLSPYGSYSSQADSSSFFVTWFNSVVDNMVAQTDAQIGRRLFELGVNRDAFPEMTQRPRLKVVEYAQKMISLEELGSFGAAFNAIFPMTDDDQLAIRHKSGFLPEELSVAKPEPEPEPDPEPEPEEDPAVETEGETGEESEDVPGELVARPFTVSDEEEATDVTYVSYDVGDPKAVLAAVSRYKRWAEEHDPTMAALLDAPIIGSDGTEEI